MKSIQRLIPHLLAVLGFMLVSVLYFSPVLQGKKILQTDIVQYVGMAKAQNDFRDQDLGEPYWTDNAFGGMPTYQMGANFPNDYIGMLDDALRFLPRPADYVFLYFLGFYILLLVLKVDPLKSFVGALAFGFSTYLIIILGAGHNAKAHAIAYMPLVVAGVILVFRQRWLSGGILLAVASALELNANHYQMTYYLLFLLAALAICFGVQAYKSKNWKPYWQAYGVFAIAALLAIGCNAGTLLATKEYADFSIRGKSELTFKPDGTPNTTTASMDYNYITEYSYGIGESLNLIAPRLFGGSNAEPLDDNSAMFDFLVRMGMPADQALESVQGMPLYWGDQPIVAAPAYLGAVVVFLAIMLFFIRRYKIKYAFLGALVLTLLLSWGKNLHFLTDFFIHYVPFYDKFRAVSSIQVIVELCAPVLAILGLHAYTQISKEEQLEALRKAAMVFGGIVVVLFLGYSMFSFSSAYDANYLQGYGQEFVDALIEDRKSVYMADVLRTIFFVGLAIAALWAYSKDKLKANVLTIAIGLLIIIDLYTVARRYVNNSDFVPASTVYQPFRMTQADAAILEDTSYYRVFEIDAINNARTSYFHRSLSGYSAVRPRRMDQLFQYQIAKNNLEVLHMLNTKYVIQHDEKGEPVVIENPDVNGPAWLVSNVLGVDSADQEMKALAGFDSKRQAIVNTKEFPLATTYDQALDSVGNHITLKRHQLNKVEYEAVTTQNVLAVFSEMYYPQGWELTVNGQPMPILRANYVLRALELKPGKHQIVMEFKPQVVRTGGIINLLSSIVLVLAILIAVVYSFKKCGSQQRL